MKNIAAFLVIVCFAVPASAVPPANDDCAGAIDLTAFIGATCDFQPFTTQDATDSDVTDCENEADVWFKATVPASGYLYFETSQVLDGWSDAELGTYSAGVGGDCSSLDLVECQDDDNVNGDNHEAIVLEGRTPGEVVYFQVQQISGRFGPFQVCVLDEAPANDDCETAIDLTASLGTDCSTRIPATNRGATDSDADGCYELDIWYKVEVPPSGNVWFETYQQDVLLMDDAELGSFPVGVGGTCDDLPSAACQDDDNATQDNNHEGTLIDDQTPGSTVYFQPRGYDPSFGPFDICIVDVPRTDNDDCLDAIDLTLGTEAGDCSQPESGSFAAATDSGVTDCNDDKDIWFRATVPASGNLGFATLPRLGRGGIDVGVYAIGDCSSPTSIACEQIGGHQSVGLTGRTPGETIAYQLTSGDDTALVDTCAFDFTPPANDSCFTAMPVTLGAGDCAPVRFSTFGATDTDQDACQNQSDVWFSTTVPASGAVAVRIDNAANDIDVGIYTSQGACDSLGFEECFDLEPEVSAFSEGDPQGVAAGLIPGDTVFFQVANDTDGSPTFGDACFFDPIPPIDCGGADPVFDEEQTVTYTDETPRGTPWEFTFEDVPSGLGSAVLQVCTLVSLNDDDRSLRFLDENDTELGRLGDLAGGERAGGCAPGCISIPVPGDALPGLAADGELSFAAVPSSEVSLSCESEGGNTVTMRLQACERTDGPYFSPSELQFLTDPFRQLHPAKAYVVSQENQVEQFGPSVLPAWVNLDGMDVQGNLLYFSVKPNGFLVNPGGGLLALKEDRIYVLDTTSGVVSEHLDLSDLGLHVSTLGGFDLLDDGSVVFTPDTTQLVRFQNRFRILRPSSAYRITPAPRRLFPYFDGGALGLGNLDALDLLPDGRLVFSVGEDVFIATADGLMFVREHKAYVWDPATGSIDVWFESNAYGLDTLDAFSEGD